MTSVEFAELAHVGRLQRGLDEGPGGWVVVSLKDDWKRVFAFE